MSNNIRWGVLSTADIGLRAVVPAIKNSKNGELVAIASRDIKKSEQAAIEMGVPRSYGNYEDLLADPDIDAVYIPLPNSMHVTWSIHCVEHGKHVLCEKPLAMSVEEIDAIAIAAEKHDRIVMEALMYRFHPQTERVVEIIQEGRLGVVQLVSSAFSYNLPNPKDIRLVSELGGGVLLDVGSYCVSVARLAMNAEPISVYGSARFGPNSDVDEVFAGLMRFSEGRFSTFGCCLHGPREQWYKITGTEASLTVPVPFAPGSDDRHLFLHTGWKRGEERDEKITIKGIDQYQAMVEHFADCIYTGSQPHVSLGESRDNIKVVSALLDSARSVHM